MRSCVVGSRTWPELDRGLILAVPLGSTEQHGPHLPLDTDTRIAMALADRLAAKRDDVAVAPALPYGSSGEHAGFPGTLSIGQAALEQLLVELVRSADYFDGVVLVNAHGGNHEPLGCAAARLRSEDRGVLAWSPRLEGGDLHAGRTETSLLLALAPDVVHVDRAAAGPTPPMAQLRAEGVAALSPTGVLGDPAGASAEEGRNLLEVMAADLVGAVAAWRP
jgi:mycofactocin precursor peptide peptidase